MGLLNKYLLRKGAINIGGLIVFAICVLLLERLLRIFQAVSNSVSPATDASLMIVNLLPYYLGMAVPMALLLGTIITVDRFSRSSELTAGLGAGISLFHMTKPFIYLAGFLAVILFLVESFLIPHGRYEYRNTLHQVKQQSQAAALRQGTFTPVDSTTFHAGIDRDGDVVGPIFIYEKLDDNGEFRITTAAKGNINVREGTRDVVLQLAKGQSYEVTQTKTLTNDLTFESSGFTGAATIAPFRARGEDEREMTTVELFENRDGSRTDRIDQNTNNAALHIRMAKVVLLLILPFIAVPFGINYGRNPSSAGIFIGIVLLVSLQKALEFAQDVGEKGGLVPWFNLWPVTLLLALTAYLAFQKSTEKNDGLIGTSLLLFIAFAIQYSAANLDLDNMLMFGLVWSAIAVVLALAFLFMSRSAYFKAVYIFGLLLLPLSLLLNGWKETGDAGGIPPYIGIWSIIVLIGIFAFFIYRKSAFKMGQPPLTSFGFWMRSAWSFAKKEFREMLQTFSWRTS